MKILLLLAAFTLAGAGAVVGQNQNEVTRATLGSGAVGGAGAVHAVVSTLGEPFAGTIQGQTYTISAGFWFGVGPASGVAEDHFVPRAFGLQGNFPNPASSGITVLYDVPRDGGRVQLRVYNVAGSLVRELVDRTEVPGRKSVRWNTTNNRDRSVGAGIYFLVMEAPGYRASSKVQVLR